MKTNPDREIVEGWLEPVSLHDVLAALRHAGFSGDVYRGGFADLNAMLKDDEAGVVHFLRHGYAESRVFRTGLDPAGLNRLRQLPVRNRVYLRNLVVALATAWTATHIRSSADIALHGPMIEQFRIMGGVPVLILGDASANLYRRGALSGERWICPLAMAPLEGIRELLRAPAGALPTQKSASDRDTIPTIWKFGQSDVQDGYPAHRLRESIGCNDMKSFQAYADVTIRDYAAFLAAAVPAQERAEHWIADLFPPVWQADLELQERIVDDRADSLLDRTAMHRVFNARLERTVAGMGFNVVRNFDSFLAAHGTIDEHYLTVRRNSDQLAYHTTRGILSVSLWNVVDSRSAAVSSTSIRDQFTQLLGEIRQVQAGRSR